jgi:hypothetical protein
MKTRGRPFAKGQSSNPGGRAKELRDVIQLARSRGPEGIKTLADIMNNDQAPPAARVGAATAILDRGYGKPPQTTDASVNALDKLSDDEQRALLAALSALDDEQGGPEGGSDQCLIKLSIGTSSDRRWAELPAARETIMTQNTAEKQRGRPFAKGRSGIRQASPGGRATRRRCSLKS